MHCLPGKRHNLVMSWNIPFERTDVRRLSERYRAQDSYQAGISNAKADRRLAGILAAARRRRHLQLSDLQEVARWKYRGPALRKLVGKNSPADVKEISRVSFTTDSERLRIGALMTLIGVAVRRQASFCILLSRTITPYSISGSCGPSVHPFPISLTDGGNTERLAGRFAMTTALPCGHWMRRFGSMTTSGSAVREPRVGPAHVTPLYDKLDLLPHPLVSCLHQLV